MSAGDLTPRWARGDLGRGEFGGGESEDEAWLRGAYERAKAEHGREAAQAIADLADRISLRVPVRRAWAWALDKWAERECARVAETGYDPDKQFRSLHDK